MRIAKARLTTLIVVFLLLGISFSQLASAETPWLDDYSYRKLITMAGSTGAGTNYVVFIKAYYSDGTDSFEVLTGGHNGVNATKIYLDGKVEADFDDVVFAETDGVTELDYFRDSYTASTSALFAVEVSEDLGSDQSFYMYFGDAGQPSRSSAVNTFRRVISSGIVLALPMNEGSGDCTDYSGNGNTGILGAGAAEPTWVTTGKFGNALSYDGGDYILVDDDVSLDLTSYVSMVFYAKLSGVVGEQTFLAKRVAPCNYAWKATGEKLEFYYNDGAAWQIADTGNVVAAGSHDVYAMSYESAVGASIQQYINGDLKATSWVLNNGNTALVANDVSLGVGSMGNGDERATGIISGAYLFNIILSETVLDDFVSYYPQCSSANLGSLFLRSFVNPEPQPLNVGSLEINNRYASTNYVWMAVLLVIAFVFMGFMLLQRRS